MTDFIPPCPRRLRCLPALWLRNGLSILVAILLTGVVPFRPVSAETDRAAHPLSERHPDAGVWVMYRGSNTVADLQKPYIKGVMAYAPWNVTYTGADSFNWYTLDTDLNFIVNTAGKRAMIDVTAGYCPHLDWPDWMREQVASRKELNSMGCAPPQFWDPVYIALHKNYIRALADHLAQFDANDARPDERDILFIRAAVMAETMENLPNENEMAGWEWQDFTPAGNGNIYKVDLTPAIMYDYQAEITLTIQREMERAYAAVGLVAPVAAAKGGHYWQPYPTRDRFVEEGVWFTEHSANPNPQGWYYDLYTRVRSGETRATTETGGRVPEDLLGQYNYWEVLAALHFGVEFIGIYGTNKYSPDLQPKGAVSFLENQEALRFADKYAGHYRNPATSPGAWVALRGGYPEERYGGKIFLRRMWTNYDFLMRQLEPQKSVMLFGQDHTVRPVDRLTPVSYRPNHRAWLGDMTACQEEFTDELCDYLWQHPTLYLGEENGKYAYTYPPSDLGQVVFCGTRMYCLNDAEATRTETMIWARRTNGQGEGQGGSASLRFDLNDEFAKSLDGNIRVRVVYLDKGEGKWQLRYDAKDDPEKSAYVLKKQGSNRWKEAYVELHDAVLANRQTGGADLTLYNMGDDEDIFHLIEVTRLTPPVLPSAPEPTASPQGEDPARRRTAVPTPDMGETDAEPDPDGPGDPPTNAPAEGTPEPPVDDPTRQDPDG